MVGGMMREALVDEDRKLIVTYPGDYTAEQVSKLMHVVERFAKRGNRTIIIPECISVEAISGQVQHVRLLETPLTKDCLRQMVARGHIC